MINKPVHATGLVQLTPEQIIAEFAHQAEQIQRLDARLNELLGNHLILEKGQGLATLENIQNRPRIGLVW